MNKAEKGIVLLRQEGVIAFLGDVLRYARRTISSAFWGSVYGVKSALYNDIVSVKGIKVDTGHPLISDQMRSKLRTKQYERPEQALITSHVAPDQPVIDLGAGIGFTTCLLDKMTSDSTTVVGVEAHSRLESAIKRTRELNDCQFEVCIAAYSSSESSVELNVADDFWSSSRFERDMDTRIETVPATSLKQIVSEFDIQAPFQVVGDIEGAEYDLISNEFELLRDNCSLMIIEMHDYTDHEPSEYVDLLCSNGFEVVEELNDVYVLSNPTA